MPHQPRIIILRPEWVHGDEFQLRAHRMLEHFETQDFGGTYSVDELDDERLVITPLSTIPRRDDELFMLTLRVALTGFIFAPDNHTTAGVSFYD